MVGCDKIMFSLLMGVVLIDILFIVVIGGLMLNGWFWGECIGFGMYLWKFFEVVKVGEMM